LLEYQTGTAGLCVISQDDTINDLSERFDVSPEVMLRELRSTAPGA
jgi:hypothetical protein